MIVPCPSSAATQGRTIRTLLAAAGLGIALLGCATTPPASSPAPAAEAPAAFDIVVRAPGPQKELLERHLELQRFRAVTDLDDAEIARLIVLAERDARELLATQGYFAPQVRIAREPGPRTVLAVDVEPGEQTKVADVDVGFEGDIATSTDADAIRQREAIRSGWGLPAGQPFTNSGWDRAKAGATRQLLARRYPAGRISYSLADVDAATNTAHLGLKLDSGPVFRLGEMKVTGVRRYDPVLVPRLARLTPGKIYDQDEIVRAQLRLSGSGYFDSAFIYVDPEANPEAAPVQVTVREAAMQKVILGLGFTTDGGPRATVEHTYNRVPGIDWRAQTKLQLEQKNPYLQTEWTGIPDEKGWRRSVLARADRLDDDTLVTYSSRLRVGRLQTGDRIDRNVYVQYENVNVTNPRNAPVTAAETGDGAALSVNYIWTRRTFDDVRSPSSGFGIGFEFGGGVTLKGGYEPFQRTLVRWLGYRPAGTGRLQLRAEAGAVLAPQDANIPATQLFRTGGDTSVRGYKYLDIGVPLPDGVVGPGRYTAVASLEWQRPIVRNGQPTEFEHTLFVDVGSVANHPGDLRPKFGVGTGVRWRSPVGPVEAAVAYGVDRRRVRLHLTVGFVF